MDYIDKLVSILQFNRFIVTRIGLMNYSAASNGVSIYTIFFLAASRGELKPTSGIKSILGDCEKRNALET